MCGDAETRKGHTDVSPVCPSRFRSSAHPYFRLYRRGVGLGGSARRRALNVW